MTVRFSVYLCAMALAGCVGGAPGGGGGEYTPDINSAERFSPEGAPECAKPASWTCPEFLPWDDTVPLYHVRRWWTPDGSRGGVEVFTVDDEPEPEGMELTDEFCTAADVDSSESDLQDLAYWTTQRRPNPLDDAHFEPRYRGLREFSAAYDQVLLHAVSCWPGNEWAYRSTTYLDASNERLTRDEWPMYGPPTQ